MLMDFQHFIGRQRKAMGCEMMGEGNLWISKSKVSSKGAGITLHNQLDTILKFDNRLVQKYIERPLLFEGLRGRKFDLRIWVLLVGGEPDIYYHTKFYGRVCSEEYSLAPESLKNETIHLTNYSQNRKSFTRRNEQQSSIIFP